MNNQTETDQVVKLNILLISLVTIFLAGCQTSSYNSQSVLTPQEIKNIQNQAAKGLPSPDFQPAAKNDAAITVWLAARRAERPPPNDDQLKNMDSDSLCAEFGKTHNALAAQEIKSRELFSDEEWITIQARKVNVGMSTRAVLASWGRPDHINSTKTSHSESDQWCYNRFPLDSFGIESKREFIYIDETGLVEAVDQ